MKVALQAAVGVSPSEPSQAVEEMKRRSREGHGQEARAERGEPVVSAAALRHGRPFALLLLAQDTGNPLSEGRDCFLFPAGLASGLHKNKMGLKGLESKAPPASLTLLPRALCVI